MANSTQDASVQARLTATRRALLAMTAGAAAIGTVGVPRAAQAAPVRGGTMIYARYVDSLLLDPVATDANADIWVMSNVYDTLLLPTVDGKGLREGLATKWETSPDGLTVTLTIRPGVKFSNGSDLKLSDIKFSLERARDPKAGPWAELVASIDSIATAEPSTVTLKLKHPDPVILAVLATFNTGIMSQAAYDAAPGATPADKSKSIGEKPVGTGAFQVVEWNHGVMMRLTRNPHYWKTAADGKQLPYLDELQFPVIGDDATRISS